MINIYEKLIKQTNYYFLKQTNYYELITKQSSTSYTHTNKYELFLIKNSEFPILMIKYTKN